MPTTPPLPFSEGLEITSISKGAEEVIVRVTSQRPTSLRAGGQMQGLLVESEEAGCQARERQAVASL